MDFEELRRINVKILKLELKYSDERSCERVGALLCGQLSEPPLPPPPLLPGFLFSHSFFKKKKKSPSDESSEQTAEQHFLFIFSLKFKFQKRQIFTSVSEQQGNIQQFAAEGSEARGVREATGSVTDARQQSRKRLGEDGSRRRFIHRRRRQDGRPAKTRRRAKLHHGGWRSSVSTLQQETQRSAGKPSRGDFLWVKRKNAADKSRWKKNQAWKWKFNQIICTKVQPLSVSLSIKLLFSAQKQLYWLILVEVHVWQRAAEVTLKARSRVCLLKQLKANANC